MNFVIIWYLIGIFLCIIGEVLFDEEITVRGLVQALGIGLLGPMILLFIILFADQLPDKVLWRKKK